MSHGDSEALLTQKWAVITATLLKTLLNDHCCFYMDSILEMTSMKYRCNVTGIFQICQKRAKGIGSNSDLQKTIAKRLALISLSGLVGLNWRYSIYIIFIFRRYLHVHVLHQQYLHYTAMEECFRNKTLNK